MAKKVTKKTSKKKVAKKNGRPSSYQSKYAHIAKFMCDRGATDKEIAQCLQHSESTINKWKHDYPEFSESLKRGKEYFDSKVEMALAERAIGYKCEDTKFFVIDGKVEEHEYMKHYPPDTTACIYWLNNRKREEWASRKAIEASVSTDEESNGIIVVPGAMSIEEWEKVGAESIKRIRDEQKKLLDAG